MAKLIILLMLPLLLTGCIPCPYIELSVTTAECRDYCRGSFISENCSHTTGVLGWEYRYYNDTNTCECFLYGCEQ